MSTTTNVDTAFTKALPKVELHAHLSGSISRATLHEIWQEKKSHNQQNDIPLEDPAIALKPAGTYPTILSFFQIFNDYIYRLINDRESISHATRSVIEDFRQDGVRYLELRTTPRAILSASISREEYVRIVLAALQQHHTEQSHLPDADRIEVHLILSIDRTMSASEADEIVSIAHKIRQTTLTLPTPKPTSQIATSQIPHPSILALDLCGNPSLGPIMHLTPCFQRARSLDFKLTVHFAETPSSGTHAELTTLLSWQPDRLGHAVHIPSDLKEVIKTRGLALELCLSCNVLSGMTEGGFKGHHFAEWRGTECAVALGTDDVGVFESGLASEYAIAAREFGLGRGEVVGLARGAVGAAFAGGERMEGLVGEFEREWEV